MFKKIESLSKLLLININRIADHLVRYYSGLPTMRRSKITPELFLGGQYSASGLKRLKEMGITAIVNMRIRSLSQEAQKAGIKYLHLPTPDRQAPKFSDLEKGATFIDEEIKSKGRVYVHCRAGEGRGPTMAISYLIKTGLTLKDALYQVQKVRSFARPTRPQMKRLEEFAEKYKKANLKKAVEKIPEVAKKKLSKT